LRNKSIMLFLVLVIFLASCQKDGDTAEKEITVSAAASLREALEEAGKLYMQKNPDIKIVYNFGGSGSLQQQIIQGAPVDVFISASEDQYQKLLTKKIIQPEDSVQLLTNELVLIVPKNREPLIDLQHLQNAKIKRIALGTPETVPAGKYAKQAIQSAGIWSDIETKLIFTKDVRQVLSYIETGNVDAGIVYKTDALISQKIKFTPLKGKISHDPIIYPAGVVASSKKHKEASSFFRFLTDRNTIDIFKKYGFDAALD
jgi:molybdate transport system substrate-binding protein